MSEPRYSPFEFYHINTQQFLYAICDSWRPDVVTENGRILASRNKEKIQSIINDMNKAKD